MATYLDFLKDPDAAARRAEFAAFVAPHAERFLPLYDAMRADVAATGRPRFRLKDGGFSAAAFFVGPVWFLYRKMWLVAGVIVAALVVLALLPLPSRIGVIVAITLGLMAKRTYVTHAIGVIQTLRAGGPVDLDRLRAAGGVSRRAAWIGGTIYAALTLAGLAATVYLLANGAPPPQ